MSLLKLNRNDDDFYRYLGPIFGSRIIEQETHDRFYDDLGKQWYLIPGSGAASVLGGRIRNFWAANPEVADELISALTQDYAYLSGVLPRQYEAFFRQRNFKTNGYRRNFIEVYYHEED